MPQGSMPCGVASNYFPSSRAKSRDPVEATFKRSQRNPSASLRMTAFYVGAWASIRPHNSGRHVACCWRSFRKRCIRRNRCKLGHSVTIRTTSFALYSHLERHVVSNPGKLIISKNYRRNRNAQNEFNHYARVARRNLRNRRKS